MDKDYIKFCTKCNWNDTEFGCICDMREAVYQCPLYMFYHPEEVKKFNRDMKEWMENRK